jgi:hypothetical protein
MELLSRKKGLQYAGSSENSYDDDYGQPAA